MKLNGLSFISIGNRCPDEANIIRLDHLEQERQDQPHNSFTSTGSSEHVDQATATQVYCWLRRPRRLDAPSSTSFWAWRFYRKEQESQEKKASAIPGVKLAALLSVAGFGRYCSRSSLADWRPADPLTCVPSLVLARTPPHSRALALTACNG